MVSVRVSRRLAAFVRQGGGGVGGVDCRAPPVVAAAAGIHSAGNQWTPSTKQYFALWASTDWASSAKDSLSSSSDAQWLSSQLLFGPSLARLSVLPSTEAGTLPMKWRS